MKQLVSLNEAADRLGIHISTIRAWVREGRVPSYRLGKRFARVSWEELLERMGTASQPVPKEAQADDEHGEGT